MDPKTCLFYTNSNEHSSSLEFNYNFIFPTCVIRLLSSAKVQNRICVRNQGTLPFVSHIVPICMQGGCPMFQKY